MTVTASRGILAVKTESSAGTYQDPTSSGTSLRVSEFAWTLGGEPKIDRSGLLSGVPSSAKPLVGAFYHELTFTVELEHWGDTSSANGINIAPLVTSGPIAVALGASDGDDATVTPTIDTESATTVSALFAQENGNMYKLRGGRAVIESAKGDGVGQVVMVTFRLQGLWEETPVAETVNIATLSSYGSGVPVQCHYATIDAGPNGVVGVSAFEFNPGQVIRPRADMTEAYGYRIPMVDHEGYPTLNLTCEEVDESTFGAWAAWIANTSAAASLQLAVGDTSGDDLFKIELPSATLAVPERSDGDGIAQYGLAIEGAYSGGYAYRFVFGEV